MAIPRELIVRTKILTAMNARFGGKVRECLVKHHVVLAKAFIESVERGEDLSTYVERCYPEIFRELDKITKEE